MSSVGSLLTCSITDMVKSEKHLLSLKSKYRDQKDLEKIDCKQLVDLTCEQQDLHQARQVTLPTALPGCRIYCKLCRSCVALPGDTLYLSHMYESCIPFYDTPPQVMAFTQKVRLCDYDPGFNIMEKSS